MNAGISTSRCHSGTHSEVSGCTSTPEVNGDDGVCQQIRVPAGAKATFWVYQGTNETNSSYAQGRYYYDSNGTQGIDWTHAGTSSSWPTPGYVVISGTEYQ